MSEQYEVGAPIPESLGRTVDLYKRTRDVRIAMQKMVDEVKAREAELKTHLIDNISKADEGGAIGQSYRATIIKKDVARIADWKAFCDYVRDNDAFDLLQKRVSEKAAMDIYEEAGALPDGLEKFVVVDVSVRKK